MKETEEGWIVGGVGEIEVPNGLYQLTPDREMPGAFVSITPVPVNNHVRGKYAKKRGGEGKSFGEKILGIRVCTYALMQDPISKGYLYDPETMKAKIEEVILLLIRKLIHFCFFTALVPR